MYPTPALFLIKGDTAGFEYPAGAICAVWCMNRSRNTPACRHRFPQVQWGALGFWNRSGTYDKKIITSFNTSAEGQHILVWNLFSVFTQHKLQAASLSWYVSCWLQIFVYLVYFSYSVSTSLSKEFVVYLYDITLRLLSSASVPFCFFIVFVVKKNIF